MTTDVKKTNTSTTSEKHIEPVVLTVIPNVLCQHADAAASLALDRFYALQSSDYNITDLKKIESRLEGNIDGLFISADEGWPHYKKHLSTDDYGEVFTTAVLAIKLHNNERFQLAFETAVDNVELLNAIADAFIWLPFQEVAPYLDMLYQTKKPEKQYVAITAYAGHRLIVDEHLMDALNSNNPLLLRRAIYTVAELGKKNLLSSIKPHVQNEDKGIQFAVCWALTRFGDANAKQALKKFLTHPQYGEQALQFIVMQKDVNDTVQLLRQLYSIEKTKRLSILGMGLLRNPSSINALIQVMADEELARAAGEAFSFITGVDLAYEDLDQDAPEDFQGGPTDDPKDENVDMDPDEDLPWPNPVLIAQWWQQNQARFQNGKKYILGKDVSHSQYKNVLIHGTQKQRAFAALAIAVQQKDEPIFNVKAPALRQMYWLGLRK